MFRWLLLLLALAAAILGSLTVFKSPDWSQWKLAVLAGEFGHWVALAPLVLIALAWGTRAGHGGLTGATIGLSALALALLLKPTVQAWGVGRGLPEKLER